MVRFGEKYKQWNAAFDAGYAAALGKALVIMHGSDHQHALKEVDGAALATVETADQVAAILNYVITGKSRDRESFKDETCTKNPTYFDGHNDILSLLYKSGSVLRVGLLILMFLQVICRAILIWIRCAKVVLGVGFLLSGYHRPSIWIVRTRR